MPHSDKVVKPLNEVIGPYTLKPTRPVSFGVNGNFKQVYPGQEVELSEGEFEVLLLSEFADQL